MKTSPSHENCILSNDHKLQRQSISIHILGAGPSSTISPLLLMYITSFRCTFGFFCVDSWSYSLVTLLMSDG